LFGVPQFTASFATTALAPFIYSFAHVGIKQVQREYNYAPESIAKLSAHLLALVSLMPALWAFSDHRAIVASFVVEALAYTIASHILANTCYRLGSDRTVVRDALSFGLPLLLNGVTLAIISQFDRTLVGFWFGVGTLAAYTVILSVSVVPISLILQVFGTLGLSYLVAAKTDQLANRNRYELLVFVFALLAVLYALSVALTLDVLTSFIFGPSFAVSPVVHILIVMIVFFRLQRGGAPTVLLLATERTRELAMLNLSAGLGLVAALVFVTLQSRFEAILVGFFIGDILSLVIWFVASPAGAALLRPRVVIDLLIASAALVIIVGTLAWRPAPTWGNRILLFCVGMMAFTVQTAVCVPRHAALRDLVFRAGSAKSSPDDPKSEEHRLQHAGLPGARDRERVSR
jgi:O-antigen/teichoic acid export membrane protein